jgi:hypothetical protein
MKYCTEDYTEDYMNNMDYNCKYYIGNKGFYIVENYIEDYLDEDYIVWAYTDVDDIVYKNYADGGDSHQWGIYQLPLPKGLHC